MIGVKNSNIGSLLKEILKKRSLSMRKLSELTGIDTATISRIINGKRNATPKHLQKLAEHTGIPITDLYEAAGYPIEQKKESPLSNDFHSSIDSIQDLLETSETYNKEFTIDQVKQQLSYYQQYSLTEEGKGIILNGFEKKLQKVGSIGPIITHLNEMFIKFKSGKCSKRELALIGSALIYFILPVDVIPDYIFPIGFIDDAIAVKLVLDLLTIKG